MPRDGPGGISLLNTADGALEQLSTIVGRLKELAEQSANGTYGVQQRKAIDTEGKHCQRNVLELSAARPSTERHFSLLNLGSSDCRLALELTVELSPDLGAQSRLAPSPRLPPMVQNPIC